MEVTALAVSADASAIRLFEGPNQSLSTFVNVTSLGLNGNSAALQQWPVDEGSIFEYARRHQLTDHTFRPQELQDQPPAEQERFFGTTASGRSITDTYCLTFPVVAPAWGMIAYLRLSPNPPFEQRQIDMLREFKPAVARVTQNGYHREVHGRTSPADKKATRDVGPSDAKTSELFAKLSRTERLILSYLRSDSTERQIAQTIHRSPHTIHVHVKNIYRKLGVNSRRMLTSLFDSAS